MILSVELIPVLKNSNLENQGGVIALWPLKRKAIKIMPDFQIKEYFFKVRIDNESYNVFIAINKYEILPLKIYKNDDISYIYISDRISSRYFLGFNLGLFELFLSVDSVKYQLTVLNNRQGMVVSEQLEHMYESVSGSDLFNLFISKYYLANASAKITNDSETQHVWLCIAFAGELLEEINKFITGEFSFFDRVRKKSIVKKYHKRSVVDKGDIDWLMQHPDELAMSPTGEIGIGCLKFNLNRVSQSIVISDHNTYENRLIVSCLYSIQSVLSALKSDYEGVKLFPHKYVDNLLNKTVATVSVLVDKLGLSPPFNELPQFTSKFIDDMCYYNLHRLIYRWYELNTITYGNDVRGPILSITTIFEHYCFIKIVECLVFNGFELDDIDLKDMDTSGKVKLIRGDEVISIFYEPIVMHSLELPIQTSKSTGYRPDIVVTYQRPGKTISGVIDAKFATPDFIRKTLGPDIYYKYGLFLHTSSNNSSLDYVFAVYPGINGDCSFGYARDDKFVENIKPKLGLFSIPFHSEAAERISEFIMATICDAK